MRSGNLSVTAWRNEITQEIYQSVTWLISWTYDSCGIRGLHMRDSYSYVFFTSRDNRIFISVMHFQKYIYPPSLFFPYLI